MSARISFLRGHGPLRPCPNCTNLKNTTRLWSIENSSERSRRFALPRNLELRSLSSYSLYYIYIFIQCIQRCLSRNREKRRLRLCNDNNSSHMASSLCNARNTYAFALTGTLRDTCDNSTMVSMYACDFWRQKISSFCENEYRDSNLYLSAKISEVDSSTAGWRNVSVFIESLNQALTEVVIYYFPGSTRTVIARSAVFF